MSMVDGSGNTYTTVEIGDQEWTVENLHTTKYMDGTDIPEVTNDTEWVGLTTPAYCWYNNDSEEGNGALYNWLVIDPNNEKKVAPDGWRAPSLVDFEDLRDYLIDNGYNWDADPPFGLTGNRVAKSMASSGGEWNASDTEGHPGNDQASNNDSGFNGFPVGVRSGISGNFGPVGVYGNWWNTTLVPFHTNRRRLVLLDYNQEGLLFNSGNDYNFGSHVRLVRDIHTVTFNSNGGSAVANARIGSGDKAAEPTAPTKAEYNFAGWYKDSALTNEWDFSTDIVEADTTLYAKWTDIDYDITYNLNGGTNHGSNPDTYTLESSTIIFEDPTRTGYTFDGWYTDAGFTTPISQITTGSTGDVTVYAKWTAIDYDITYNLNGGTNSLSNPDTYTIEDDTIIFEDPTRTGYTFNGWYTDAEFNTEITDIPQGSTGDVTVYAKWTAIDYDITYNLNGGTNHGSNPATYTIESSTITFLDPTRTDYTFNGWYTDAEFNTEITDIPQGSTGDVTIYARWVRMIDGSGNGYTSIVIGDQEWIVENLHTTKYADGTDIPNVTDGTTWAGLSTPAYCWYNNDDEQGYGALYNWWVVDPANAKDVAPAGWRVPTDADWTVLADYLGGDSVAGGKMKTTGTEDWDSPNTGATNDSGFSGLPGGSRSGNGNMRNVGGFGSWWSDTEGDASAAKERNLRYNGEYLGWFNSDERAGLSVRLIKDTYIVTFDSDGGTAIANAVVDNGGLATAPTAPTKANHDFAGWYADAGLTTEFDFSTDVITEHTTIYARWIDGFSKANNQDDLNLGSSWAGGVAPGSSDTPKWEANVTGNNYVSAGTSLTWNSVEFIDQGGDVTINNNQVTLGIATNGTGLTNNSGKNIYLNSNIGLTNDQQWHINSGNVYIGGRVPTTSRRLYKYGAGELIFDANQTQNLSAIGIYAGKVTINSGTFNPTANFGARSSTILVRTQFEMNGGKITIQNNHYGLNISEGTGATATINGGELDIHRATVGWGSSNCSLIINAGTHTINDIFMRDGGSNTKVTLQNCTVLNLHTRIFSHAVFSTLIVELNTGSVLQTERIDGFLNHASSTGPYLLKVAFDGGTLKAASSAYDLIGVFTGAAAEHGVFTVELLGGGGTIDLNGYNQTIQQAIEGTGKLTVAGTGTEVLTLTQTSTYTGGTDLNSGYVNASVDNPLGTGLITMNSGSRRLQPTDVTLDNDIEINAGVSPIAGYGAIRARVGNVTVNGDITINSDTVSGGHFSADTGYLLTVTGSITASPGVTVTSRWGNLKLSGGGSYERFWFGAGTITVDANNGIATNAYWDMYPSWGSTYVDLNGYNQTCAGIRLFAAHANNANVINNSATDSILTIDNTADYDYPKSIQDNIALVKAGTGKQTLSGNNTYTGTTTINAGTLEVNGSITNSNVEVGGTLTGTGTLGGASTVNATGILDAKSLTFTNALTFNATATLKYDLGTASDITTVTGSGTLTLNGLLEVTAVTGFGVGTYTLIDLSGHTGSVVDNTLAIESAPADYGYTVTYDSNGVYLNVVETHILSFNPNTGTGSMDSLELEEDETINLPANIFTKTGHTFTSWNTAADGTGTAYADEASFTMGSADATLYAQWTAIDYDITYNLNGGTNHGSNPATYTLESSTIIFEDPTRTGYTFDGWYTDAGFTTPITEISQGSIGDVTVYAKWTAIDYDITYNLNGGTNHGSNPATYTIESSTITFLYPTRTGYTFDGWYDSNSFITQVTQIPAGSTGSVVVYAKWVEIVTEVKKRRIMIVS